MDGRIRLGVLVLAVTVVISTDPLSATESRQFSDFPVAETYDGKPAIIDNATAPENWLAVGPIEKDIIRDEMAKGPNFAGAYYLATVGCGSGCEAIFVIDLRNGKVYSSTEAASNGVLFQKDSSLIIIKGNPMYDLPQSYLVFHKGEFKKIE